MQHVRPNFVMQGEYSPQGVYGFVCFCMSLCADADPKILSKHTVVTFLHPAHYAYEISHCQLTNLSKSSCNLNSGQCELPVVTAPRMYESILVSGYAVM